MKKIILLGLMSLSLVANAITPIESPYVEKNGKNIGESYIAQFDSQEEKEAKVIREYQYMQSKNDFKAFTDGDGVAFMATYKTPVDYTVSFKGFCGDKYISVSGNSMYFDDLLNYFLQKTKEYGYNF